MAAEEPHDTITSLVLSLPALDSRELNKTKNDLIKLNLWNETAAEALAVKTCTDSSTATTSSTLSTELESVLMAPYKEKGVTAARFTVQHGDDGVTMVRTYAEQLDEQNCSTGNWSSEWAYQDGQLSGSAHLHVYYYEEGSNVQLRATRDFASTTARTDHDVATQIASWEKELYNELSNMFEEMDASLRKIRRILPITKTRFKWDSAAQTQVRLLNARAVS